VSLDTDDLAPFATIDADKAQAMIDDTLARAARVAPCILDADLSEANAAAAKAILRDVVLRKNDAGTGAMQSQTAGPFGVSLDTRQPVRTLFWPSDISELQSICADHNGDVDNTSGAFEIDTAPATSGVYGVDYWWTGPDSTSTTF
jgi:hypothetical protein